MEQLHYSGHPIDTFAQALGLSADANVRAALNHPILVSRDDNWPAFADAVEALVRSTERLVVVVDHNWLEDHYFDDHGYGQPMATAHELIDGNLTRIPVMLHHASDGLARLCAADYSKAYLTKIDGGGCWQNLSSQLKANVLPGVKRAGEHWFWNHDLLTTQDIIAVEREMDTEERLGLLRPLPGVKLNLGYRRNANHSGE